MPCHQVHVSRWCRIVWKKNSREVGVGGELRGSVMAGCWGRAAAAAAAAALFVDNGLILRCPSITFHRGVLGGPRPTVNGTKTDVSVLMLMMLRWWHSDVAGTNAQSRNQKFISGLFSHVSPVPFFPFLPLPFFRVPLSSPRLELAPKVQLWNLEERC